MTIFRSLLILSLFSSSLAQQYETSAYYKAEQLFIKKDYPEALRIIKSISPENDYYQNALLLKGHIYLNVDSLTKAESSFREILSYNPESELAYNGLGLVHYYRIANRKTVIKFFQKLFVKTEAEESEEMFKKALELNETYADAHFNLARLYIRTGNEIQKITAENLLSGLLRNYPSNYMYSYALGEIKLQLGKIGEAGRIYKKLISVSPENGNLHIQLALVYWNDKKYDQFSDNYLSGISYKPDITVFSKLITDCWDILSETEQKLVESDLLDSSVLLKFWNKKDPNPITPVNERLIIHYERLDIARERYKADSFTGYDDRGSIYVKYGEPDQRYADPFPRFDVKANESWGYKIGSKIISFDFIQEGSNYTKVNDLTEAVNMTSLGKTGLTILADMYQNRSHLDGYYQRITNDLLAIDPSSAINVASLNELTPVVMRYQNDRIKAINNAPLSTFNYKLEGSDLPFQMNSAWFYEANDKIRLELYFALNPKDVNKQADEKENYPLLEQSIHVQSQNYSTLVRGVNKIDINKSQSLTGDYIFLTKVFLTELNPVCTVQLENKQQNQKRLVRLPLKILPLKAEMFSASAVQVSADIHTKTELDKAAFTKKDLYILPYPYKMIRKSKPIFFYFELYNVPKDQDGISEFQVEYKLYQKERPLNLAGLLKRIIPRQKDDISSVATTMIRRSEQDIIQEYLALDMNALNPGNYQMIIKITSTKTSDIVNRRLEFELVD